MLTRVYSSGFCAPMVLAHGITCNGAYKRLGILHWFVGLEVSGEGSLGQIDQGFGQWLMKSHWLGFSPEFGVFPDKHMCSCLCVLLLVPFMIIIPLGKLFMFSIKCF